MESGCAGHRPNVCLHTACRLPPNSDGYQRGGPSHEEKRSLNIETKSHTESNNSMKTLTFGSNYPMKAISNNTRPRYRCGKTWLMLVVAAAVYLRGNGQDYVNLTKITLASASMTLLWDVWFLVANLAARELPQVAANGNANGAFTPYGWGG